MKIEVNHLSGGYSKVPVLHDLNFDINGGEIVGLIGLNGAGKSTTIKHLVGLLRPLEGEILIDGHSLETEGEKYRQDLSYIPELPVLYEALTLREHLELVAMSHDLPFEEALEKAEPLLKKFRLWERLDWLPIHFSKGMKQKVMIICAMMLDSSFFVVDEPFVGLDPLGIADFTDELLQKKANGAGILVSTHILSEAEKFCDRFIFLQDGRLRMMGTVEELKKGLHMEDKSLDDVYLALARGNDDE